MERIGWMRQARRPIAITSDIIVGFPGETEKDFEDTLDLLEEVKYDSIFSFKVFPAAYMRQPWNWAIRFRGRENAATL